MSQWGSVERGISLPPGRPARRQTRAGEREPPPPVLPEWQVGIQPSLELLPGVSAVLASAFEHKRGAVLVHRVMKCGDQPPCVAVALPKGQRTATLIRDSHAFALSILQRATKLMIRRLAPDEEGDALETFPVRTLATGSPILLDAVACVDCEVVRHFDLEGDHEMYVGQVIAAAVFKNEPVLVPGRDLIVTPSDACQATQVKVDPASGEGDASAPGRSADRPRRSARARERVAG